ncbi:MAG: hypothetical protein IJJ33_07290 [Victivallales bacterium]|nr:hypothetical protein [Victivallales bacterium]
MNNVRDFGAVGDGVSLDTQAIQRTIDAGGIAFFPPGIYLSGTLYLRSGGGLELSPGAVLLASPNPVDYNADDFCPQNQVFVGDQVSGAHLICAVEQHDIVLRGGGRIDGSARTWLNELHQLGCRMSYRYPAWRPGQLLYFCESEHITIQDLCIDDAPYWAVMVHGSRHVAIHNLRITSDMQGHNGDGIDIDCSRFVNISDCQIEGSDDCITLRANERGLKHPQNCEYVTVSNCILKTYECAVRLGVGTGLIRNATFSDILIRGACTAVNVCSCWRYGGRSASVENAVFHDFIIDAERPINVTDVVSLGQQSEVNVTSHLRNICFRHWHGRASRSGNIRVCGGGEISNVSLADFRLEYHGANQKATSAGGSWYDGSPVYSSAFAVVGAEQVSFKDVEVTWAPDAENWQGLLLASRCPNLMVDGEKVAVKGGVFAK